jgi:hypothetical protein
MRVECLPLPTPYDSAEDPSGSVDPLGTVTGAEQLADAMSIANCPARTLTAPKSRLHGDRSSYPLRVLPAQISSAFFLQFEARLTGFVGRKLWSFPLSKRLSVFCSPGIRPSYGNRGHNLSGSPK